MELHLKLQSAQYTTEINREPRSSVFHRSYVQALVCMRAHVIKAR